MGQLLHDFLAAPQTLGVCALILLDLLSGVWSAVRRGVFSWARLSDILTGPTLRHLAGYGAAYLVARGGLETALTPYLGAAGAGVVGQLVATTASGFSVLTLIESVRANIREARQPDAAPASAPGLEAIDLWPIEAAANSSAGTTSPANLEDAR